MSDWEDIPPALKTRADAVPGIERFYESEQYALTGLESDEVKARFGEQIEDGRWRIHYWFIRKPQTLPSLCLDAMEARKETHSVEIVGYRVLETEANSENSFQNLGQSLVRALNSGDRTLGGACHTHGDATMRFRTLEWSRVAGAHEVVISLEIEENTDGPGV